MEMLQQQLIGPAEPAPISWWPPAPGWWIVAISLLLLLLLLPWLQAQARRRRQRRVKRGMHALADIPAGLPDNQWLAEINIRLKQLLKQRGDEAATRLHGQAWLDYLCTRQPAARQALQPLAADLYRPHTHLSEAERRALLKALRHWMRHDHV